MDRRRFIIGSAAATSALAGRAAFAQDAEPTHAITFVNPFPPGGVADVIARPLAAALEACERYYQAFQFVVWAGKSASEALDAILFETSGAA